MSQISTNYSRIFLLSHMRAFTSLAGHILGSHPQINGYYEMHISYQDVSALDTQLDTFQQHETLKGDSCYLFDKLLHDDYRLNPELLDAIDIKLLVALSEPERTIKSIVDLFARKESDERYASPVEATKYYIDRVENLAQFCKSVSRRYFYFNADMFRDAPDRLLPRLTRWLRLDSPLSQRYQLFSQTAKARRGDSSKRILSGEITSAKSDYSHIRLPEDALTRAQTAYRDCRGIIIENARDSIIL